jgi:hypothetical protein
MSRTILYINFNLKDPENDTLEPVIVELKDTISKTSKMFELKDGSDESFKEFTKNLSEVMQPLLQILPQKSDMKDKESYFKRYDDQKQIFQQLQSTTENTIGQSQSVNQPGFSGCNVKLLDIISDDIKEKLNFLIKTNSSIAISIPDSVKKIFQKNGGKASDQDFVLEKMKGACYLGGFDLGSGEPSPVFITTDCILTDGYSILPFKIGGTVEKPEIKPREKLSIDVVGIDENWKLHEDCGTEGTLVKERYLVTGDKIYDVCSALLKKYGTYEISDIVFTYEKKSDCKPFLQSDLATQISQDVITKLRTLQEKNKDKIPTKEEKESHIVQLFNKYESATEPYNDKQKLLLQYCKDIVNDKCCQYLGSYEYGYYSDLPDKKSKPIYISRDGIITDGYAILDFNVDGEDDSMKPGISGGFSSFKSYSGLWKICHTDNSAGTLYRSEYDMAIEKIKTEKKYGGSRKTIHKRYINRKTRRLPNKIFI